MQRFNGGVSGLQPIGLGLELGCGGGSGTDGPIFEWPRSCGFTMLQLQELQLQSLIYEYIEAGFPVPYHLVLPIWKSVISSFGGLSANLYQLFPTLMDCNAFNLKKHGNKMDPEPGRCRRTDGKKWRCSKEVVPEHKYCERHRHRGRQHSRKLVEASFLDTACTNISLPAATVSSSSTSNNGSS